MGHINIDGLLNKIPEIKVIIEESDLDILSITETHLSATVSDDRLGEFRGLRGPRGPEKKSAKSEVRGMNHDKSPQNPRSAE